MNNNNWNGFAHYNDSDDDDDAAEESDFNTYRLPESNAYTGIWRITFNNMVRFRGVNISSYNLFQYEQYLLMLFRDVLFYVIQAEGLEDNDRLMLTIQGGNVNGASSRAEFVYLWTPERILRLIERALQSAEQFNLEDAIFKFAYAKSLRGGNGDGHTVLLNKKCVMKVSVNTGNDCFFHCLVLGLAEHQDEMITQQWGTLKKERDRVSAVQNLKRVLGVVSDEPVPISAIPIYEQRLGLCIHVISSDTLDFLTPLKGQSEDRHIFLLHIDNHFHYVMKDRVGNLYNRMSFCITCRKAYRFVHDCSMTQCRCCLKSNCSGVQRRDVPALMCSKCNNFFFDNVCIRNHKQLCSVYKRCTDCNAKYRVERGSKHKCGCLQCASCKAFYPANGNHVCFITELEAEDLKTTTNLIFYDYESMILENGEHETAIIVAIESHSDEPQIFSNTAEFLDWALEKWGCTFIAHNGGRYDVHFIKKELVKRKIVTSDVATGNTYMSVTIPAPPKPRKRGRGKLNDELEEEEEEKGPIRFIDSYRFIPSPLRQFPAIFGLENIEKGHFPYTFLTPETLNYVGPMPPMKHFCFEGLKNKKEFEKAREWYEEHKHEEIDLYAMMVEYCIDDVLLLKRGCLKFRELFLDVSQQEIDPFQYMTIASVCMSIYRRFFMPSETIQVMDPSVYAGFNLLEQEYAAWIKYQYPEAEIFPNNAIISLTAQTPSSVYKLVNCFEHGCMKCFFPKYFNPHMQKDMGYLRRQFERNISCFSDFDVNIVWACDWEILKVTNHQIGALFKNWQNPCRDLHPRDAFYGGRTEPTKLMVKNAEIDYVDYTSLYPSVQHGNSMRGLTNETYETIRATRYPIGVPMVLYDPHPDFVRECFGLVRCRILPPRGLYHPVLPCRVHGKLYFTLCYSCARNSIKKCEHSDEERSLLGVWTSVEIQKAMELGYQLMDVHCVWHYIDSSSELFTDYVESFLKLKQQANGREKLLQESHCDTIEEYIDFYYNHTGIKLNADEIPEKKNAGMVTIAKLCLNSLWGKFGQRENMGKTKDVYSHEEMHKIVFNERYVTTSILCPSREVTTIKYAQKAELIRPNSTTNVVICAFTTAYARLRLYEVLEQLGERVCYMDTDSAIYLKTDVNPKVGCFLGDLTCELDPDDVIETFMSTGCKSYAYRTASGKETLKVKGIALNIANQERLNFESLESVIKDKQQIETEDMKFIIQPLESITTKYQTKLFRNTFDKRYIYYSDDNLIDTRPYGYE